ncbi:MAG: hypothetical protein ACI9SC_000443 [Gammaproteobacteria bacterium]|jgi:hypothetical protein
MMKWFFILLLLMNVLYFAWELDRQTRMDVTYKSSLPAVPDQARRLQFLEELETPPLLREMEDPLLIETMSDVEESTSVLASLSQNSDAPEDNLLVELDSEFPDIDPFVEQIIPGPATCFSFGPIADEIQATGLQKWFVTQGATARMRHTDELGRQLFWVYLAPQDSRQDAMATIKSFQDSGVRDFRLIVKGNLQNAISMGLFSNQSSVNKRLNELKKKGYKPVVVPYSDGKRVYWIDAELPQDEAILGKVFNDYPSRFSSIPVNCMEIAMASDNP